jgi:hypothetical protein
LACVHEIQLCGRSEKHASVCSDSQAALKALQAARLSPLMQECQKALNYYLCPGCSGAVLGPRTCGVQGNKITKELTTDSSVQKFVGPELTLGVSRQNIRNICHWSVNQHWARWRSLGNTQETELELILGLCPSVRTRFLSFNRTQSRVIIGPGHNTLRRLLHLNSLSCRRCAPEDETSTHILLNVKLWLHSDKCIWALRGHLEI